MSIPKIIHYFYDDVNIWEKNQKSQVRMCINSWLKYCPDYKFMLWHDKMPEFQEIISKSEFAKRAYKLKLWAFVSDYIRLYALNKYGGIYLDTDVELVKNLDEFLENKFFLSIEGDILYGTNIPEPAVMGGIPNHPLVKEAMNLYESEEIFKIKNFIANVIMGKAIYNLYGFNKINYQSEELEETAKKYYNYKSPKTYMDNFDLYKKQKIYTDSQREITIYPSEYFCPTWDRFKTKAFTKNTAAIHWNQSSWFDEDKIQKLCTGNIIQENKELEKTYLFAGILPFMFSNTKFVSKDKSIQICKIFYFFPLIKITLNKDKKYYYLFNFIPLWKTKNYHYDRMHYLFQFIPVLKLKEKYSNSL